MSIKTEIAANLELLNSFREGEGLAPVAAWRKARHQPMLDAYMTVHEKELADAEAAHAKEVGDDPNAHTKAALAKIHETKPLSYKHLARKAPEKSTIGTPVDFVHTYLNTNPKLTRKQAIAALVEAGVNFSTARTQYQKWFAANKAGA